MRLRKITSKEAIEVMKRTSNIEKKTINLIFISKDR